MTYTQQLRMERDYYREHFQHFRDKARRLERELAAAKADNAPAAS